MGLSEEEIEDVCSAILCTGPRSKISEIVFRCEEARLMAYMLAAEANVAELKRRLEAGEV